MRPAALISSLLTATLVVTLVPTAAAIAVPAAVDAPHVDESIGPEFIDDADTEAWTYVGNWLPASGQSWTADNHLGTETWSNETGARAQLQFFGTEVAVIGPKGPNGGSYRITLDCAHVVEGTSFAPTKVMGQELARFDDLHRGWHTVVVEVLGGTPHESTNDFVIIDVARVHDESTTAGGPEEPFVGRSSDLLGDVVTDPLVLHRPGCGAASSLVDALKTRVVNGEFLVPGASTLSDVYGRVNAHSASWSGGPHLAPPPAGPVTLFGEPIEAATIPAYAGVTPLKLSVPDRPRTLQLELVADETFDAPIEFAVSGPDSSTLLPMLVNDSEGVRRVSGTTTRLEPGIPTTILIDLRDQHGAGQFSDLTLWSRTMAVAQLDIISGRTSDVALDRLAGQVFGLGAIPSDPAKLAVPPSALQYGSVVLSRVLADFDQPAWIGDERSATEELTTGTPLLLGEVSPGVPFSVGGHALPATTIGVRLPETTGAETSSVVLRFDTSNRCRFFTALVGLDDSTPAKDAATVSLGVFGDGEALAARHSGTWWDSPLSADDPIALGVVRSTLAGQLLSAKQAAIIAAGDSGGADQPGLEAVARAEHDAFRATAWSNSAEHMTYSVANPLTLGVGSTVQHGAPTTFVPHNGVPQGVAPIDPSAMFPLAVDLITSHSRDLLRTAATSRGGSIHQVPTPLVRDLRIVVSGTPGAVLALGSAGLECVSIEPPSGHGAPTPAMPRFSQLGVPPLFLPTPRDPGGHSLDTLAANPMWWDTVCPQGPSVSGAQYVASKVRKTTYHWVLLAPNGHPYSVSRTLSEVSTASNPACAFPADQLTAAYGDYVPESNAHVPEGATVTNVHVVDSVREQYDQIGLDWSERALDWMRGIVADASQDAAGWAVWLVLAPFDPFGAVLFNPLTMRALPLEAQVVVGLAYFSVTELEAGIARVLPAVGNRVAGTRAGELLLTSLGRAEADATAGTAALIDLGEGGSLLVPLKESAVADIAVPRRATPFVEADRATSMMPSGARARVPWFTDAGTVTSEEILRLCARDAETKCSTKGGVAIAPKPPATAEWIPGRLGAYRKQPAAGHADGNSPSSGYGSTARGYRERYTATITTVLLDDPAAAAAIAAMNSMSTTPLVDAATAYVLVPGGAKLAPVVATDSLPLYRFDPRPPWEVFESGFALHPNALVAGSDTWLNVYESARVGSHPGELALMKSTTRDPDMLSTGFATGPLASHWRYKISRPTGGGGIDVRATFERWAGSSPLLASQSMERMILGEAEVVFPGGIQSKFIERADYLEFNPTTGQYTVIASHPNPHFDSSLVPGGVLPQLSWAEASGATQWVRRGWVKFDWLQQSPTNEPGSFVGGIVGPPPVEMVSSKLGNPGSHLVYLKNLKDWALVPRWFTLTDEDLARAGFVVGYWESHVGKVSTWVPVEVGTPAGFRASDAQPRVKREVDEPTAVMIVGAGGALRETRNPYAPMGPSGGVYDVTFDGVDDTESRWFVVHAGNGTARFINEATGNALQVTGQVSPKRPEDYIVVTSPAAWNTDWQQWMIEDRGPDGVLLRSVKLPGIVLRVPAADCEPVAACVAVAGPESLAPELWSLH